MFRSTYDWGIDGEVIWIEDKDQGRSVTNDMENVLVEIWAQLPEGTSFLDYRIVYGDTQGTWDEVEINKIDTSQIRDDLKSLQREGASYWSKGIQPGFRYLGGKNKTEAILMMEMRIKSDRYERPSVQESD